MNRIARNLTIALSLLMASILMASVSVDYDDSVDFRKYATFAWTEGTPAPTPMAEKRIRSAIEAELESKGLKRTDEKADLYVITHAQASVQQHVSGTTAGYGSYRSGWGTTSLRVHEVPVGTLVVDLVDGESNTLVWRSTVTATISRKPEKNEKKLQNAARKMFKGFPPEAP